MSIFKHLLALIILIVLLGLVYSFVKPSSTTTPTTSLPQAVDLKITLALNQSTIVDGTTITVWAVTEDSRCPSDVQCIQAGRVRVALHFATSSGDSIVEVEIGKTVTTETLSITLDEVTPYPVSTRKISDGEYTFVLSVKGK